MSTPKAKGKPKPPLKDVKEILDRELRFLCFREGVPFTSEEDAADGHIWGYEFASAIAAAKSPVVDAVDAYGYFHARMTAAVSGNKNFTGDLNEVVNAGELLKLKQEILSHFDSVPRTYSFYFHINNPQKRDEA